MRINSMSNTLTDREKDIIRVYVEECLSIRELGARFGVKEPTMKNHLRRIYDKTGMSKTLELARWAIVHGYAKWEIKQ